MSNSSDTPNELKPVELLDSVAIRIAGDSGDGIQVTGARFTTQTAIFGNDLATLPDFPAEIRAPAGTLAGVSSFQINFGSVEIFTAGDSPDVLVAMNPAALKANLKDLRQNGTLICNSDAFNERNLVRVGYKTSPLEDPELSTKYALVSVPLTELTHLALMDQGLTKSAVDKCKNFFALGIIAWMYSRTVDETLSWIDEKFGKNPKVAAANRAALLGGMAFAEASELVARRYQVKPARLAAGNYRNITGNMGIALGLIAAGELLGDPILYSGYPITPASEILHELARHKNFGVVTVQAEDEIAACCIAIGASYAGKLGVTASSGPGIALKQEAIGLAVMTELPLVIVNVQRGGPSTGLPTKTEQADLLEVMFGRNSESPVAVIAMSTPSDAFETTIEACRIAVEHMVPVFLLSDGYIGNGSEPWLTPRFEELKPIARKIVTTPPAEGKFMPYARDEKTLVRNWGIPGSAGLEHRIGGLEKFNTTGNISYDPANHEAMVQIRAQRIERIADRLPPLVVNGDESGELLIVSWGGTYSAVAAAVKGAQRDGLSVSHIHLRYLNPFQKELESILGKFNRILVPELNLGQLKMLLRAKFLVDAVGLNKVQGQPFKVSEIRAAIDAELGAGMNNKQRVAC